MKRLVTLVGVVLLMLGMFPMDIAIAQTPEATPSASPVASDSGWLIADIRALEVDGDVGALSPDGQWLAGVGPEGDSICIWDVKALTPTCTDESLPIDRQSIVWSPDSSAVAFSLDVTGRDVYVYELGGGTLTNLTGGGITASTDTPSTPSRVNLIPTWSPDGQQIAFIRFVLSETDPLFTTIMRIDRVSGEPTEIVQLDSDDSSYMPIFWLPDDTILYSVNSRSTLGDDNRYGIWRVGVDGSGPVQVVPGSEGSDIPGASITEVSADGRVASVYSPYLLDQSAIVGEEDSFWIVDVASGERTALPPLDIENIERVETLPASPSELLSDPALAFPASPAVLSPDGSLAFVIYRTAGGELYIALIDTATSKPVLLERPASDAEIGWTGYLRSDWAENNTILVEIRQGQMLITLEQAP